MRPEARFIEMKMRIAELGVWFSTAVLTLYTKILAYFSAIEVTIEISNRLLRFLTTRYTAIATVNINTITLSTMQEYLIQLTSL